MNDNEIIKALELFEILVCETDAQKKTICSALDLINRQQAEIERLQNENNQFADIGKMYSEIKTEAIKEFAERLKHMLGLISGFDYDCSTIFYHIDNLVKEMVGDTE